MLGTPSCHGDRVSPSLSTFRGCELQRVSHLPVPRTEFKRSNLGSGKSIIPEEMLKTDKALCSGQPDNLNLGVGCGLHCYIILAWRFIVCLFT